MRVLNPLYDWAFKYLMDNNELARRFLSVILKMNVERLETRNVELPLLSEGNPFLSRFDFKAVVEAGGRTREVLIELQKYRHPDPIARFRAYLGENYLRQEGFRDASGQDRSESLPLIAVYILGYRPAEFHTPYVIVRNRILDGVDESELKVESPMAELLTHPMYVLMASPPKDYRWRGTPQEAVIRLFRQKTRAQEPNSTYELERAPEDEVARELADYLHQGTLDPLIVKRAKAEEEHAEAIVELEAEVVQARREKEEAIKEKQDALKREEDALKQKQDALREKEDALREKALARQRMLDSAREFLRLGFSAEKAAALTGLTPEELAGL